MHAFIYIVADHTKPNVAKVGRSENAVQRVNSIRGNLPWSETYLYRTFKIAVDRVVDLERFIHKNLPFERLCYPSGRKSEWYKIQDLEEFTTSVEILCNVSPHVESIVQQSINMQQFLYTNLPRLSADALVALMHRCQEHDPLKRLWRYQLMCPNACYKEGLFTCNCDRLGARFAAVLIDVGTFREQDNLVDTH